MKKRLVFAVTNDLVYDQRMIRICSTLAAAGYDVTLIGGRLRHSPALVARPFRQKRLRCFFSKGKLFYAEFNLKLFFALLFRSAGAICAIDLDTILPVYLASSIKGIPRIYDAHELFCEMKEVVTRPGIYAMWKRVERFAVPRFRLGYTVNEPIAAEFYRMYGVNYEVIRNMPRLLPLAIPEKKEKYILYQGAVNEGRCFETLIPAMHHVNVPLVICGDGNFMRQAQKLVQREGLGDKVLFKGRILPQELRNYTLHACIGITLFDNTGLSNYYSLANRFFDYMHAGVPQLCVNYPVYKIINNRCPVAVLIDDTGEAAIAGGLNRLLSDGRLYGELQQNCLLLREEMNWQEEEKKLITFYQNALINFG